MLSSMEQTNVYNSINFYVRQQRPDQQHGARDEDRHVHLPLGRRRPSSGIRRADELHGRHGELDRLDGGCGSECRTGSAERCLSTATVPRRFADVTDGLSNTAFFSERILADFTTGIVSPIADVFFSPAAPTTNAQATQLCQAINIYDPASQFPLFMGAPGSTASTFSSGHGAEHALMRLLRLPSRVHAAEQPASWRREPAHGRWIGPLREGLDQHRNLAGPRLTRGRRGHQLRLILNGKDLATMLHSRTSSGHAAPGRMPRCVRDLACHRRRASGRMFRLSVGRHPWTPAALGKP